MANNTVSSLDAVLKEHYDGQRMVQMAFGREDTPAMNSLTKKDRISGRKHPLPMQYGRGQGMSADLTTAISNATAIAVEQFEITTKPFYHVAYWEGEALRSCMGDKGAFLDLAKTIATDAIERVGTFFEFLFFSNGNGAIGQISSGYNTTTITLTDPSQCMVLEVGMKLDFAASETGAITNSSSLSITDIDAEAGTVTLSAAPSTVSAGASDYIFLDGTGPNNSTVKLPVGVAGWIPYAAPGSTSFFGVDRTADINKLAGYRLDGSALSGYAHTVKKLVMKIGRSGLTAWCSPLIWEQISEELGEQVTRSAGGKGVAGFSSLEVATPFGKVPVKMSKFCPDNRLYALDHSTWALYSKGPAIDWFNHDGLGKLRMLEATDAVVGKVGGYSQFGCKNPSRNGVANLTDVD